MKTKNEKMSKRQLMFAENVRRVVSDIILKNMSPEEIGVKNPTIGKAVTGADLRIVKLYVNCGLYDTDAQKRLIANLQKNEARIKSLLAKKIVIRFVPQLQFIADKGIKSAEGEVVWQDVKEISEDML